MNFKARTKTMLGLTVAGVAASVMIPATAHASDGYQTICNAGQGTQYYSFRQVNQYPGIDLPATGPGECWTSWVAGLPRQVEVYVLDNNGQWQYGLTTTASGVKFGVV